jgi:hypothetical protein
MTTADAVLYIAQFIGGTLYALFLEFATGRKYENRGHTWGTVVAGVAMVGIISYVWLRYVEIPFLAPLDLAMWFWWRCLPFSFTAAGVPIILWQLIVHDRNVRELTTLEEAE